MVRMIIGLVLVNVYCRMIEIGIVKVLIDVGVVIFLLGCGLCFGRYMGVVGDGDVILSIINRNFRGRMGLFNFEIYFVSLVIVVFSVFYGEIIILEGGV